MHSILFTGFPGFVGSQLLGRLLARHPEAQAYCLVQPTFAATAKERIAALDPDVAGRIHPVEGDITRQGLGLGAPPWLKSVDHVFHLAAVYDLTVSRPLALSVNVEGTRNVLAVVDRCSKLSRLHYVSTCYVSGRYPGVFHEADLDVGQRFNNFYEETKFLAEAEVQEWMRAGGSATIYRPSVVVGDAGTGVTHKYDGPYFVLTFLLRGRGLALLPVAGDSRRFHVNLVPRDFVTAAIEHLSARSDTVGGVFNLADPSPPTVRELIRLMGSATDRRVVPVRVPRRLAEWAVRSIPPIGRWTGIPAEAMAYFAHPTRYGTRATEAALEESGLRCPRLAEYLPTLVEFVRAHPEVGRTAMV